MGLRLTIQDGNGNQLLEGGAWYSSIHELYTKETRNARRDKCEHRIKHMCNHCNCDDDTWTKITFDKYLEVLKNNPKVLQQNTNVSSSFCKKNLFNSCQKNSCIDCDVLMSEGSHFDCIWVNIS